MSNISNNVSNQMSQMTPEEIESVLVWVDAIRSETAQRLSQMASEDAERALVEEAFVEVEGLAKALRAGA